MTAGASAGNLPAPAVLSLPVLFAAGMCVMDTTDGVLMSKAYNWALLNPLRKIFYNITTTSLSVAVALIIGSIELLQVFIAMRRLHGRVFDSWRGWILGSSGASSLGCFCWRGLVHGDLEIRTDRATLCGAIRLPQPSTPTRQWYRAHARPLPLTACQCSHLSYVGM